MTFASEQELTSWVLSPHLGWGSAQQVTGRLRPPHSLSDGEENREGADCCRHQCATHHLLPLGAADCLDVSDESWGSTFLLTDGISLVLFWFWWLILPSVQCFVILHQHISAAGRTFMGYFALLSCSLFFLLPIMLFQGSFPSSLVYFFFFLWMLVVSFLLFVCCHLSVSHTIQLLWTGKVGGVSQWEWTLADLGSSGSPSGLPSAI